MSTSNKHDAIVLIHRSHANWEVEGSQSPLFVCAEMFLSLRDIEARRWQMWALRGELAAGGIAVATLSEFLLAQDIEWLEHQGARVAHGWYLDAEGQDPTVYREVSLGRCIEYDAKARAIRLLKLSRCIQRLRESHPGARVLTDYDKQSIEYRLLESLRIHVQHFGCVAGQPPRTSTAPLAPPTPSARMIARGRHLGLVAMRGLSRLSARRQPPSTPTIVVRVGMQSTLMLQSWLAKRQPGLHFSLWMDYLMRPRTMLSLVLAGHSITASPMVAPATHPSLEKISAELVQHFARQRGRLSPDAHLHPLLADMLSELSNASFPVARAAIDDAYAELGQPATTLLVIPNDCQLLMRAWTLVATLQGQASLVLQHGHLDYTEDGDHHTATHSAFWSNMVARDYVAAGLRPEQILVTGSPNADDYVRRQRTALPTTSAGKCTRPQILIITTGNPGVQAYISETWVCDYIAGILDALSPRFGDFSITIKLHPGENAELYRQHLGPRLPSGNEISDRGDLVQMISDADLVISPPSTVVIEARAGGTAVILMPVPTVEGRQTSLAEVEGVVTVLRHEDLPATIDAMLADPSQVQAGTWTLDRFLGPLDGQASARLLDAVEALAHAPHRSDLPVPHHSNFESNAVH
jgi:hypothetical protein